MDMTEQIQTLLKEALEKGFITVGEAEEAKSLMVGSDSADFDWTLLQPIIDKAQGVEPVDPIEDEERLRLARAEHPLHCSDFTNTELKMLKELAPDEYRLLK